jgi:MFS family permease
MLLDSVTSFAGGGVTVLLVILALDVLGAGEAGVGYLNAATGVGGVLVGFLAGGMVGQRLGIPLLGGGIVAATGFAWLAIAGDLWVAMVAVAVAVGALLLLDIVNTTLIQRLLPNEVHGRAMGLIGTVGALMYAAGSFAYPILGTALGVGPILVTSGAVTLAGAALALILAGRAAGPAPLSEESRRLVDLPTFAGLPAARLEAAAREAEPIAVETGTAIVREGDPADRFYVILDGRFGVTQRDASGSERPLRELGPDQVFGELGLLRRTPRTATVTALTDGRLLTVDGEAFLALVGAGPGLSTRLLDLYRGGSGASLRE